jgi:high-affinity iron transporter
VNRRRTAVLLGAGVLVAVAAVGGYALTRGSGVPNRIVVSQDGCGFGWTPPRSGRTVFTVENTTPKTVYSVEIMNASLSSIYGQIDALAPSTDLPLDVVLPPGTYLFRCQTAAGDTLVSPTGQVHGAPVIDAHPYTPADDVQMQFAMVDYRASLMPVLQRLVADTDRLSAAVRSGELGTARRLWLPAHLDYAQLGVAYDTFGEFNDEINERPVGLVGGVRSPKFHGFLRLEYGLWHGQSVATLTPVVTALDTAVHGLLARFPKMAIPDGDLSLRAHEILENTLQFELTGETDEGSNTNLATAWANVQGTGLAVHALRSVLGTANPTLLANATAGLGRLSGILASYRRPDGTWAALQSLTIAQHEQLDGTLSGLLEQLELIPDELQPAPTGEADD